VPKRLMLLFTLVCLLLATTAAAQDDETFDGELTDDEPSAVYEIDLEEGEIITLATDTDDDLDTILTLFNPDGDEVAENDDAEGSTTTTSLIEYVAEESGTYTIEVTGFNDDTGTFTLTISFGADFGLSEDAEVLLEETVSLDSETTEEKFYVSLVAGDIVVITTEALTDDLDTTLELLDEGGDSVAENDDRGDGTTNSQIIYEVPEDGNYTVVVSSFQGDEEGDLLLSIATDATAEPPFDFASIQGDVIEQYEDTLDDDQPSLEYTVELESGDTLLALTDVTDGDLDTVLNLYDPEGIIIASNDDRGDGSFNSAIAFTAAVAGEYTVEVERFPRGDSSGDFELTLSSVDESVVETLTALLEETVTLSGDVEIIETENFRIHYTLEGADATTAEYAQQVADTLEEVYDVQVNQIGWAEPVRGSDGLYPVYIADALGSDDAFGYASPTVVVLDNPNTPDVRETGATRAVFVIDNDFEDVDKEASALSLMRATSTHEFNHVIQFGYDQQEGLDWLYESTASWTETTTVGNDQDATDYVTSDFEAPELCFTSEENDGGLAYGQWTLLQSLADQYGEQIVVRLWENAVTFDGFETMERTLEEVETTIPEVIEYWRAQNFARDYDLAPLFERAVWVEATIDDEGEWTFEGAGIQELGANYYVLDLNGSYQFTLDGEDSLQLIALAVTEDEVQVIRLGEEGTFDTTAYDYSALMVFNEAMPDEPGDCSFTDYTIEVTEAEGAMPDVAYTFSAEHFEELD
jgi:hypothetical protein